MELVDNIIEDLKTELSREDDFDETILTQKVNQAYREVKSARKYPDFYTDALIEKDMQKFYSQIRNIALYDYNKVGAEFQTNHNESSVSRSWVERDSLFSGIIPLSRL